QRTAVAAATDVLPTPPLPVKRTTRTGEVYVRGLGSRRGWKVGHAPPALRATSPLCGEELRPSGASRHLPTLWGGVTPVRRFAPPPHSVGRSYAPPALRATSPLCVEELRRSGASRHLGR